MRARNCLLLMLVGALVLGTGTVLKLWQWATSPDRLRAEIKRGLAQSLHGDLRVGAVSLSAGCVLRAGDVEFFPPASDKPLVHLKDLLCEFDRGEFVRGRLLPRRVRLSEPHLALRQDPQGLWNLSTALKEGLGSALGTPLPPRLLQDGLSVVDGTLSLRSVLLFRDERTRRIPGINLSVARDGVQRETWRLRCDVAEGALRGAGVEGWLRAGEPPQFELRASVASLNVDKEFLWALPAFGRDFPLFGRSIWETFQPRGPFEVTATLRSPPEGGPVQYWLRVRPRGVTVLTEYFPVPIRSVAGTLDVVGDEVIFRDVGGVIPPEAFGRSPRYHVATHVTARGVYHIKSDAVDVQIEAVDVPLCKRSVEAIPDEGERIWRELRPAGSVDVGLNVTDRGSDRPTRCVTTVRLKGASVSVPGYPLVLEGLSGEMVVREESVHFAGLSGVIRLKGAPGPGAPIRLSGVYDPLGRNTRVELTVKNLRVDRKFTEAIPELGEGFWELLRAEGRVDATVVLRGALSDEGGLSSSIALTVRSGRALPSFCPVPVRDLTGTLFVEGGAVRVANLTGRLVHDLDALPDAETLGTVTIRGKVDVPSEKGTFRVEINDLSLCRQIVESVPQVGKALWKELRPQGQVAVSGTIRYEGIKEQSVSYYLNVKLKGADISLNEPDLSFHSVGGDLFLTEEQLTAGFLTALAAGGRVNAALFSQFGEHWNDTTYRANVTFHGVDLAALLKQLAGTDYDMQGRLSGLIDLKGRLGHGAETSASGAVELTDGYLGTAPFFASLMDVLHLTLPTPQQALDKGEMRFVLEHRKVQIPRIQVASPGFELSGLGTVALDGTLDLTMVAATLPRGGIPIVSHALRLVLRPVERELAKFRVRGTLANPRFESVAWNVFKEPVRGLFDLLLSPFRGGKPQQGDRPKP